MKSRHCEQFLGNYNKNEKKEVNKKSEVLLMLEWQ